MKAQANNSAKSSTNTPRQSPPALLEADQIEGKVLDHLGLIASVIHKIGLIELVDKELPVSSKQGAKLTMGERVGAMVMNALGFIDDRLYLFPEFMRNKPISRLFMGKELSADYFNDDAMGRCLDAIHEYGSTELFSKLAFVIGTKWKLFGRTARLDTTSLSVYGDYPSNENEAESGVVDKPTDAEAKDSLKVTYGYSKDHRQDLKQMILLMATTGASGFPMWMESHSGNASDQKTLQQAAQRMKNLCKEIKDAPSFIFVGDSAMYCACVEKGGDLVWLSRVPRSIGNAKQIEDLPDSAIKWMQVPDSDQYKICEFKSTYSGVKQRWLLVSSEEGRKAGLATLERDVAREKEALSAKLEALSHKAFFCEKDAEKYFKTRVEKTAKYHDLKHTIKVLTQHAGKGRPRKGAKPEKFRECRILATLTENQAKIEAAAVSVGRFILATNELDKARLSSTDMLLEYKQQSKVESGFKFIKGNTFQVSSVFLKKPERIDALMMVMVLSLMVYGLAEFWLRESLKKHNETIPNQLKKPTDKPTMAWVARLFHGVQVLRISFDEHLQQELVSNLNAVTRRIVRHFGVEALKIYGLAES